MLDYSNSSWRKQKKRFVMSTWDGKCKQKILETWQLPYFCHPQFLSVISHFVEADSGQQIIFNINNNFLHWHNAGSILIFLHSLGRKYCIRDWDLFLASKAYLGVLGEKWDCSGKENILMKNHWNIFFLIDWVGAGRFSRQFLSSISKNPCLGCLSRALSTALMLEGGRENFQGSWGGIQCWNNWSCRASKVLLAPSGGRKQPK